LESLVLFFVFLPDQTQNVFLLDFRVFLFFSVVSAAVLDNFGDVFGFFYSVIDGIVFLIFILWIFGLGEYFEKVFDL
jgi:hypothetical protein